MNNIFTVAELGIYNIFIALFGFALALILMVIKNYLENKNEEIREIKNKLKNHKFSIIYTGLSKFENMQIKCDDFTRWDAKNNFKVYIEFLENFEKENVYNWAIQHLNAYPVIYEFWDDSIKRINGDDGLNEELKGLKKYLSDKIKNKFEEEPYDLHSNIWCILENAKKDFEKLDEFFKGIKIEIKGKWVDVVLNNRITLAHINCKEINVNTVKNFLSNLIKEKDFREKVKSFIIGYKELKETFEENFIIKLKGLLQNLKDDEDNLKGECKKCSDWIKKLEIEHH